MTGIDLSGFVAVALVVVITPGSDMALVARNTLTAGRSAGLVTSLGTCTGLLVHAIGAALGLSAILATSAGAFTVVKLAGAGYLVYLGVRSIRHAGDTHDANAAGSGGGWVSAYRQGVLTNVLNPKVAIFFLSLLPQFVAPGDGATARILLLAGVFVGMGIAWLSGYTLALSMIRGIFARPAVRRAS